MQKESCIPDVCMVVSPILRALCNGIKFDLHSYVATKHKDPIAIIEKWFAGKKCKHPPI